MKNEKKTKDRTKEKNQEEEENERKQMNRNECHNRESRLNRNEKVSGKLVPSFDANRIHRSNLVSIQSVHVKFIPI